MGIDVYKVYHSFMYGSISQDELEFIERYFYRSDDGSYYIKEDFLNEAIENAKTDSDIDFEKLVDLIEAFRKELNDNPDGCFNFTLI